MPNGLSWGVRGCGEWPFPIQRSGGDGIVPFFRSKSEIGEGRLLVPVAMLLGLSGKSFRASASFIQCSLFSSSSIKLPIHRSSALGREAKHFPSKHIANQEKRRARQKKTLALVRQRAIHSRQPIGWAVHPMLMQTTCSAKVRRWLSDATSSRGHPFCPYLPVASATRLIR